MHDEIRDILARITQLEDELRDALEARQQELRFRIEGTRVRFEAGIREAHQRIRIGILPWIRRAELRNVVTAPVIYGLVVPLVLLDVCVTVYQMLCFPLYRVPAVPRSAYIVLDRHQLRYLNSIERLNCIYCGYANGLIAYVREVGARTEQYWCPIKHARHVLDPHRRYARFADFGAAEGYQETVARLRRELAEERAGNG